MRDECTSMPGHVLMAMYTRMYFVCTMNAHACLRARMPGHTCIFFVCTVELGRMCCVLHVVRLCISGVVIVAQAAAVRLRPCDVCMTLHCRLSPHTCPASACTVFMHGIVPHFRFLSVCLLGCTHCYTTVCDILFMF